MKQQVQRSSPNKIPNRRAYGSECQVAGRLEPAKVVQKADNKFDEQVPELCERFRRTLGHGLRLVRTEASSFVLGSCVALSPWRQVSVRNNKQIWLNYTQEKDLPAATLHHLATSDPHCALGYKARVRTSAAPQNKIPCQARSAVVPLVAEEVFHLLKRMHRAARIPDDDAEALQIGAAHLVACASSNDWNGCRPLRQGAHSLSKAQPTSLPDPNVRSEVRAKSMRRTKTPIPRSLESKREKFWVTFG